MTIPLAAGYQIPENGELFSGIVKDYKDTLREIYFSWCDEPSGRPGKPISSWDDQVQLEYELTEIRKLGLKLDLLFNANCYGAEAISEHLAAKVCNLLDHMDELGLLPDIVTTTSPFVAETVRSHFPGIELRASVNMRLDSTLALEFLGERFDSFYIRRDLQRDLDTVRLFREWCDKHGKRMGILANSGCLRNCPFQTFHDNLVAHQRDVFKYKNVESAMKPYCMKHYLLPENRSDFLRGSWIRPDDLKHYEGLVDFVKLATRQHDHPRSVIAAYSAGHYEGDLAALMEPNYSNLFADKGIFVDSAAIPDFDSLPKGCATNCTHCGKCERLWEKVCKHFR